MVELEASPYSADKLDALITGSRTYSVTFSIQDLEQCCKLPGTKLSEGEFPLQAAERIKDAELSALASAIKMTSSARVVETKYSKEFAITTQYHKRIFHATFEEAEVEGGVAVQKADSKGGCSQGSSSSGQSTHDTVGSTLSSLEAQLSIMGLVEARGKKDSSAIYAW